jgi:hypothetical protein
MQGDNTSYQDDIQEETVRFSEVPQVKPEMFKTAQ